ncbi:MAG TPA: hypothetical protein VIC81_04400 [Acidimicrobiales bacterium]|jgi:hypothetical protein
MATPPQSSVAWIALGPARVHVPGPRKGTTTGPAPAARVPSSATPLPFGAGAVAKFEPVATVEEECGCPLAALVVSRATLGTGPGLFVVVVVVDVVDAVATSDVVVVSVVAVVRWGDVVAVDVGRALRVRISTSNNTGLDQTIHLVPRSESKSFGIAVVRYWDWGFEEMVHLY